MAMEIIEGTIAPTQPSHRKRGYCHYKTLDIAVPDGEVRTLRKVAAGPAMGEHIAQGGTGRYYVANVDGATALVGVRQGEGTATYAHYTNLEPIILIAGLFGTAAAVARFGFGVDVILLPCILGPVLLLAWVYLRQQRISHRRAFDADGG